MSRNCCCWYAVAENRFIAASGLRHVAKIDEINLLRCRAYREGPNLLRLGFGGTLGCVTIHALEVESGPLQGVRIPKELVLDVRHQHRLASLTELLLENPAADFQGSTILQGTANHKCTSDKVMNISSCQHYGA